MICSATASRRAAASVGQATANRDAGERRAAMANRAAAGRAANGTGPT